MLCWEIFLFKQGGYSTNGTPKDLMSTLWVSFAHTFSVSYI